MRLIRNITKDHRGKYAVVRMQKLPDDPGARADVDFAFRMLEHHGMLEWGEPKTEGEFFVINAQRPLRARCAESLRSRGARRDAGDEAYADDVCELTGRAGRNSPFCKRPD
jgi:hypothetical protein